MVTTNRAETQYVKSRNRGTVRLQIPAAVAYDLPSLQRAIGTLVERLGCKACFSGSACDFRNERDFVMSTDKRITAAAYATPDASSLRGENVKVALPASVSYDIEKIRELTARIADKVGHSSCFSGFDISFGEEIIYVVNEQGVLHAASEF
jgi:hypothetical protein